MQKLSNLGQQKEGMTWIDLQTLPPYQKKIINWIRQRENCSLLDIAVHFCQDEETIFIRLNPLVKKGFVMQILGDNDNIYYRVIFAPRRPRHIPVELIRGEDREQ
jgi:hypothetical protein